MTEIYFESEIITLNEVSSFSGKIYPSEICIPVFEEYKLKIKNKTAFGSIHDPLKYRSMIQSDLYSIKVEDIPSIEFYNIKVEDISHIFESIEINDNKVIGNARILNTPKGNIIKELMRIGKTFRFILISIAKANENKVISDFEILSIDLELL